MCAYNSRSGFASIEKNQFQDNHAVVWLFMTGLQTSVLFDVKEIF